MEPVRQKVLERLHGIFHDDDLAKSLERALYNWTVRSSRKDDIPQFWQNPAFRYRYTTKALSLQFNLTNPQNPKLLERVLSGELSLHKLVRATPSELFPELWEPVFERVASKQLRKQLTTDAESAPDGVFTCSKCSSKKTVFYEMQTRSADEPMTVFIQCLACQRRWKQ